MVFSSVIFLCLFLPTVFVLYRLIPGIRAKNLLLTAFSLVFYSFGSLTCLPLLLSSVFCNYLAGRILITAAGRRKTAVVALATAVNLGLLGTFKYLGFFVTNLNLLTPLSLPVPDIVLPIGISFFTFQGMSYVFDVSRDPGLGSRSFIKVLLYISYFPQLVAGPIVRYSTVAAQIDCRQCTRALTLSGIRRFVVGLSKKLLIADVMGVVADQVYGLPSDGLDLRLAWLGALCYALQIYFDFSGYSDMAIGLARMFGFRFLENFEHPYSAGSIQSFWRRWHISLTSWFTEYLYIPLGGSRASTAKTVRNRMIVFLLTGLWHGANWTFVLWGLWHGVLLNAEQLILRRTGCRRPPRILGHIYTPLAALLGFVLFRAETVTQAGAMFRAMFTGFSHTAGQTAALCNLTTPLTVVTLLLAVVGCTPAIPSLLRFARSRWGTAADYVTLAAVPVLLLADLCTLAAVNFSPFIYFQF